MKTFKDLVFNPHSFDPNGVQAVMMFDNNRGVSVVEFDGSYSYKQDQWELAVLDNMENVDYETSITDDVIGWLTDEEVSNIMIQVQNLTPLDKV
jgi:hypothetical protein